MKILFIVSTLAKSGPTNQLYYLIKNLDRSHFDPYLITLSPEQSQGSAWADFEALGVQLRTLGLSRIQGLFFSKRHLRSLVDRIGPDVIHTQGIRADVLNATVLSDYPSLCTSRNYPFEDYPTKFGKLRGGLMARRHMSAFEKLNVMACSRSIQSQLGARGINAGVVQNGVDTQKFRPVDIQSKKTLRRKLNLPEDSLVLLSVGSLIPRKDMKTLISAFQQVGISDAKLVVLGGGPQMDLLRQKVGSSVRMPGNVANVSDYFGAADLFVSAALSEGLPNTVLEAMSFGLPCVLSDIPPHRELFGDSGQFFPCGNSEELAGLVRSFASNGNEAVRSRQIVEEYFSDFRMSQAYQEIYNHLARSRLHQRL